MHRCGVDRYQQSRFVDQRGESEQIQLGGKIDCWYFQLLSDSGEMSPFSGVVSTGQDRAQPELLCCECDRRRPAIRFPEFILACRAWMKNGEWFIPDLTSYNCRSVCVGCFRQLECQFRGRGGDSEGLEQSQIIVNCVHFFHRAANEFGIAASAKSGLMTDPIGDNTLRCAR